VDGELVSMCEVNALGVRERYYAQLSRRGRPARSAPPAEAPATRSPPNAPAGRPYRLRRAGGQPNRPTSAR
jgi:hypothetical protein